MPYRRTDWHEHILDIWREYRSTRFAVDRLQAQVKTTPDLLKKAPDVGKSLRDADQNLEGTYIIRLFAAFEAALRSFDRSKHDDPSRLTAASIMIDEIGGKKGRGILIRIRDGVHEVRRVRNYWAHESDQNPDPTMTIDSARSQLQNYLCELPDDWD